MNQKWKIQHVHLLLLHSNEKRNVKSLIGIVHEKGLEIRLIRSLELCRKIVMVNVHISEMLHFYLSRKVIFYVLVVSKRLLLHFSKKNANI